MKKLIAITLVLTMVFALAACGSQSSAGSKNDGAVSITIFNSKMEIQSQMEQM